jgi:putative ABC transport system permease protein
MPTQSRGHRTPFLWEHVRYAIELRMHGRNRPELGFTCAGPLPQLTAGGVAAAKQVSRRTYAAALRKHAIPRPMLFFQLIVKNLRRRWARSALTILGLAVAVMATTTLWTIAWGYADAAQEFYSDRGVDIVVVRAGVANRLTSSLRSDLSTRLKAVPGVDDVDGSLTEMVSVGKAILVGIPLRGLNPDGFTIAKLPIGEGRSLTAQDHGTVIVGNAIAAALGKKPGDSLDVEGKQFQVIGIIQASNPFDANCIIAPVRDVQALMGRPETTSEFQVRAATSVRDDAGLKEVCRRIEALQDDQHQLLGLKAQPTHQFVSTATESKLGGASAWAITAIVVVLSFASILNTMLMSVIERTKELGILRAVGWRRGRVLRMILGESAVISLAGAIVGLVLSWVLIMILSAWPRTALLVPATISTAALLPGLAVAIVAGLAGAVYPAIHAASVPPIESLRYE